MNDVLLSVVIPVYNASEYIEECLLAVCNQTYKNLEIIVVDDGSKDNSLAICKMYAMRDSRIKILSHPNKGVSATRNDGIEAATGDYIIFCDADDFPEEDLAHNYVSAIERWEKKKYSFIVCGMFFDNDLNKNVRDKKHILEIAHGYVEGENYLMSRSSSAILSWLKIFNFVTNKCYNLNVIRNNNLRFDEAINIGEDLKFNLDYLECTPGHIGMINLALYHYVKRRDDSLSISYHISDLEDTKIIYRRFIEWESKQDGVNDDNILVLKGIYISDWVSRLTAYYEEYGGRKSSKRVRIKLQSELRCKEFQTTLKEIRKGKKISRLRYMCLRTGVFEVFYFFRGIYQIMKG